jgi:hypothetical protein
MKYIQFDNQTGKINAITDLPVSVFPPGRAQLTVPDDTVTDGMKVNIADFTLIPDEPVTGEAPEPE